MKRRSVSGLVFDISNHLFLILVFCVMVLPFLYIISYSVSNPSLLKGGLILFPVGFTFDSYKLAFQDPAIITGIFISVARTIIGPIVMLFFTSMAGYVLTRRELVGAKFFRKYFVFTMYVSSGLVPMYIAMNLLHLTGTFLIYVLPGAISIFNMILIKTYIESVPKSLEEAAIIDGANDFVLFFKVIFPVCMPVLAAVTLFTCVNQWNTFIDAQIYNTMYPNLYPLQYVLYNTLTSVSSLEQLQRQAAESQPLATPQSLKMAITVITILPIACVYPLLQKYFMKGLLIGSIKG
ncbi:sugar ABC transporter permease [Paenibacillus nasutitermitis]|uniref:Sugar ABC transporter permease n=2 Tax=Paenibacillus nasutitermitis TaxID=1652958 RepID=A0A916YMM8_9BACL|nr:sugar ABC transporter permease [Paenibacillus nasutitermitis]